MRTAFNGVDIVYIRVYVLTVVGVVHHSHLDRYALLLCLQIYNIVKQVRAVTVDIAHKLFQSVFCMEHFLSCLSLLIGTQVCQRNLYAGVKICQLAHTLRYDVVFIYRCGEYRRIRPELLTGSAQFGFADNLYRIERLAFSYSC